MRRARSPSASLALRRRPVNSSHASSRFVIKRSTEVAMQRIVAVVLVLMLVAPPASAGQKANASVDWVRVQQLRTGAKITLTVTGSPATKVRFLFADDAGLVTLKLTGPKAGDRVEGVLLRIGPKWPAILNIGESVEDGRVRVSREGVFDGARKVANLADLVQQTPRGDVLALPEAAPEPPHSHWVRNVLIALAVAVAAAWLICVAARVCGPD